MLGENGNFSSAMDNQGCFLSAHVPLNLSRSTPYFSCCMTKEAVTVTGITHFHSLYGREGRWRSRMRKQNSLRFVMFGVSFEVHFLRRFVIHGSLLSASFIRIARSPRQWRWNYFVFSPSREIRFTCSGFFDKLRSARYKILELLAPDISPWVPGPSSVR